MKTSTVLVLVLGGLAVLFWAFSKGLIKSGAVPIGPGGQVRGGILAPQPAQNYSGYLAASTAPGVSATLNTILGGLNTALTGWFSGKASSSAAASPAGPAGPIGPTAAQLGYNPQADMPSPVGPQGDPATSYDTTNFDAFGYDPLASDNAYDPNYSLESV